MTEPADILEQGAITFKDRGEAYGDFRENMKDVASFWSTYKGVAFSPRDVCHMMGLVKIAREKNKPKFDNTLDAAVYEAMAGAMEDNKT